MVLLRMKLKIPKPVYVTSFYYQMETNSAQAASLALNEVLFNDWRRSLRINEDMKKVSVEDVNKAFNKYVKDITWVYQGDTSKVTSSFIYCRTFGYKSARYQSQE